MSYSEIFIMGWNLNALMFVVNLILALNVMKSNDPVEVSKAHEKLGQLKEEIDEYYPNRGLETLASYLIPFTAFYRVSFRLYEMSMFFKLNQDATMFDFMIYRYEKDIQVAKTK